jgi:tetratricopeptide (TPR) repeat protein
MIMMTCHASKRRWLYAIPSLLVVTLGCSAAVAPAVDRNAALMAAEVALERSDCKSASQNYLLAAQGSRDLKLLTRATDVALDCGQYPVAEQVTARWRSVAPDDSLAVMNLLRAQLGRAHIAEARATWVSWLSSNAAADSKVIVGAIDWLLEHQGSELVLATLRGVKHERMASAPVQLRMAELAIDGSDLNLALNYADAAAKAGGKAAAAGDAVALQTIRMRAHGALGNADAALAAARSLVDDGKQPLAVAETLLLLGRDAEATSELLKLRADSQLQNLVDRRLALLAFADGNYREAEQRFTGLLRDQNLAAMAVFYMAQIAERRGDAEEAVRGYELLANSPYDAAARRRIAGIYLHDGERAQALRMVAANDDADISARIGAELMQAELLADGGTASDGVARLDAALVNYPAHPEIGYQRAVLLERYDSNAAVAALEALAKARPADLNITNALGFTLADHNRELPRAERLIRSALSAQPDSPAILDSMGWVLHRRGQSQAALPYLQRAYLLYHEGDIGAHLGEVLWKLNRHNEARAIWTRALAADPENANLAATAKRFAPELKAPKPPPSLGDGPGTAV